MSFSSSLHNLSRICGYNQAVRHFEETRKPKTARWGEDERPLYNTRSHHYRLVKGSDNYAPYYDLVLYDTSMIRYYQPEADGASRVLVRGHHTSLSNNFLWYHGFGRGKQFTCENADGTFREGRLLLNHAVGMASAREHGVPRDFSADLYFLNAHGDDYYNRLDLTRSKHIPGYKAASSAEDKAKRKQLKGLVDHWIELLGYRLDEYLNTEISGTAAQWRLNRAGDSFTSAVDLMTWSDQDAIRSALRHALNGGEDAMSTEFFVNAMTQLGHAVATHLEGLEENRAAPKYDWRTRTSIPTKEVQPVTREAFRKSMESHLISLLSLREGSARVDIGQFPATIPRRWWC